MTQKYVNLGGWLVLERWITPSLFADTAVRDEFGLASLGKNHQDRIKRHYESYITKSDIVWLHDRGVTQLRVPIGYWLFGDQAPYVACSQYLDQLFDWAGEFDMEIILSIHAAPGSQNGKFHSGKIGEANWYKHTDQLTDFTLRVAKHYGERSNFAGLGLLNEPDPSGVNIWRLIRYYRQMIRQLKRRNPQIAIYIDGTFNAWFWAPFARIHGVGLDLHLYHGFDKGTDINKSLRRLRLTSWFINRLRHMPIIIGEWSGVIDRQPDSATTRNYIKLQQQAYAPFANFYWTYKTESGGYWSFRHVFTTKNRAH